MQLPKGHRVLVVEDEGLIALDIARRLETLGHSVVATVATAEEAIAQAAQADLVLMDIRIDGDRDGVDAASEIRARCNIPVIFLTAHADRSTLERAKLAGPFGYIVKPLGPATLQSSIEVAVYKHSMERQLEEREAWMRTTLASAAEAIVAADRNGRVLLLNAAAEALTGWSQAEAQQHLLGEVLRLTQGETGAEVRDLESLAILEDAPVSLDRGLHIHSRSGRAAQVEGCVAPVRVSRGTVGIVVSLHDVTAHRWQERQLRQAQRMEAVGRLAAGISTDYSNLIGIIRHQAVQLTAQFGEYSPARRAIDEIHQAAAAADQITRRLASFGARPAVQPEAASLNSIVKRMAKTIESVAGTNLTVAVQPQSGAGRILTDPAQLEQAIMSLVLHACSVTPTGGTLVLETANVEAGTVDARSGVPPARGRYAGFAALTLRYSASEPDVEHLFDPSDAGESGFALAVAQSIVVEQGGFLSARTLAEGTEVQMLLPILEESALAPASAPPGEARTVLLIEPRDRVRAHLHNVAESVGYNLLEAVDANEAIDLLEVQDSAVDLLIASAEDADQVTLGLGARQPQKILRLVDGPELDAAELRRPFTQKELVDRITSLVGEEQADTASA